MCSLPRAMVPIKGRCSLRTEGPLLGGPFYFLCLRWSLRLFRARFEFGNQLGDFPGTAGPEGAKSNSRAFSAVEHGNVPGDVELQLASHKIDFDGSSALQVENSRSNKTAGKAEVENFAAEEQASVGNADLCAALARVARVMPAVGGKFGDARGLHGGRGGWHRDRKRLSFHDCCLGTQPVYRQIWVQDDGEKKKDRAGRSFSVMSRPDQPTRRVMLFSMVSLGT